MSINNSITSVSAPPVSILELAQLVPNAAPESGADPTAFLAALVRQFGATKGGTQVSTGGESSVIASAETNESRADPLQELLQYVSNLETFSNLQFQECAEAGVTGGNGLPDEGKPMPDALLFNEDPESENLAADPLLAALTAYMIPSASAQSNSPVPISGEASAPQAPAEDVAALQSSQTFGSGQGVTGEELSMNDVSANPGQAFPSSDLSNGGLNASDDEAAMHGELIPASLQREGVGSKSTESNSPGTAPSGVEGPDALLSPLLAATSDGKGSIKPEAGESLISQVDKKLSALMAVSTKGIEPSMEAGISLEAMPPALRLPSMIAADDFVSGLDKPLNAPGWQEGLGDRIIWMAEKSLQSAEIRLNPAHLGPLEIRIQMDQDQATIHFATHHATVREAIEAAVPKLREMLGTHEISLADVNVMVPSGSPDEKGPSFDFNQQSRFGDGSQPFSGPVSEKDKSVPTDSGRVMAANGLLNLYA
jgi:flagellar hook-length control protein FliK